MTDIIRDIMLAKKSELARQAATFNTQIEQVKNQYDGLRSQQSVYLNQIADIDIALSQRDAESPSEEPTPSSEILTAAEMPNSDEKNAAAKTAASKTAK